MAQKTRMRPICLGRFFCFCFYVTITKLRYQTRTSQLPRFSGVILVGGFLSGLLVYYLRVKPIIAHKSADFISPQPRPRLLYLKLGYSPSVLGGEIKLAAALFVEVLIL